MVLEVERPARLVAIVGPTATGKSALALQVAERFSGEIISCDSVQVYRGLDIGSGKPSVAERALVPHHLIDVVDVDEEMNAAIFAQRAATAIQDISSRARLPILAGGTGLYLTALLKGLFEQGSGDTELRNRLNDLAERYGPERLHRVLALKDPVYAAKTKAADRVRIVRALEVCFGSGRAFSEVQATRRPVFSGETLLIGLHPDREELRDRVQKRTARMLAAGLVSETRRVREALAQSVSPPRPLNSIGYRQVMSRLATGAVPDGGDDELLRAIVISTMQYAKRQMTYFRHQFAVEWFTEQDAALARISSWVLAEAMGDKA